MTHGTTIHDADIEPETLASLPSFYAPTVSPDGHELAFFHDTSGRMELYTLSLFDGEWTRWSDGNVPTNLSGGIEWAADGEGIYFHRDEDGDEQNDIHVIERDGTTEPVVETDGQTHLMAVDPNGEFLVCASTHAGQMNLHRYDLDGTATQLTEHEDRVNHFAGALSPDGDRVAYATNESDNPENLDVFVVDADGDEPTNLHIGETGATAGVGDWFPDGERLLVGDDTPDLGRAGVYDRREDSVRWLSEGDGVERPAAVSPDGQRALVMRTREAATVPVIYDVATAESQELDVPTGVASGISGSEGGFVDETTVFLTNQTGAERQSLLRYDLDDDSVEAVLEPEYDGVDPSLFVEPEYVTYDSEDGLEIGALLYEARDDPGPAIVYPHGGPTAQTQRGFNLYLQFLVSEGYTVLAPNYRGSTGRGREFRNRIREDWGGMEQVDIKRGAEWLAERDSVDPDRIAIFGISYGGYSAYCQLTMYPEPWAAGVAHVGMSDLHALYEESMPHFKSILEDMLGDPAENADRYSERSAINHVDNLEDPIHIIHGVNDPRCPISQARLFRDALEERGLTAGEDGDFEYTELGAEGHGSTDIEQKTRAFELLADFLDRRV
ncbi:Dipeptidyl aminopeptidase/acylaminoacyl peptidase [Halovenus aranensis]|uniref:Dipeptidyl aminopeptidase/acylaminoacyl peptidase n=1 Tax=Halovenus aranensis TaxID=890420 RepID=A0A1G8T2V8_9EURY|nr:S9 family peptidase [Halovenus aranensis]SDJ35711.1 Dipeptidyl aminopeptidase/acylaminoacyl peptidase [Halovenus aranensis]